MRLTAADVVVAEEGEGAQTRLVAVFHSRFPTRLGPVRSARSTDAQLLPLFGRPGLVYSGANRRVQAKLDRASLVPVQRETRNPRRFAPHNVFLNLEALAATREVGRATAIGWVFDAADTAWRGAPRAVQPRSQVGHDTFSFDRHGDAYTVRWNGARYVDGDSGRAVDADGHDLTLRPGRTWVTL